MIFIIKQFLNLRQIFWNFILLFFIFLTACTFNQELKIKKALSITSPLYINHHKKLNNVTRFQTYGTFVYIDQNNKIYGNFFWHQYNFNNYRLLLNNPLGVKELGIKVTESITEVIDRNGKKYLNIHPEQIIYQLIGMRIPIKNLSHWLIGLPTINSTSFTLDKNGLLKTIQYRENKQIWNLKYLGYYQDGEVKLPRRIELTQGTLRIKLKIDNWRLNE